MSKRTRNSDPTAMRRARQLRLNMGETERKLWRRLRNKSIGFRFRRQFPVGPYVLDFFCYDAKLCVEVDGESHQYRAKSDAERDRYLEGRAIKTLRFQTVDVIENTDAVLEVIYRECCKRSQRTPFADSYGSPPP